MADVMIGLAEAITGLREQLLAAISDGQGSPMRFRLAPVELTLRIAATKGGDGKVGWSVLGVGGSYSSEMAQTLVLRLEPMWHQDDGSYAADFTIAEQIDEQPFFGPKSPGVS